MFKYVTIAIVILLLLPAALFADSEDTFGYFSQDENVRLVSTPVISGTGDSLSLREKEQSQPACREKTLTLFHFTAGTLIGMGNVHFDPEGKDQRSYFILEPEANAEINMVRFFRVCAGASCRMAMGLSGLAGLEDAALSGLSANLFL
jgi:hypothetical protein